MRALETGRPVIRATNTGITAAIDHKGQVLASLPAFTTGVLCVHVQGMTGMTPYIIWGNIPALGVSIGLLTLFGIRQRTVRHNGTTHRGTLAADKLCT